MNLKILLMRHGNSNFNQFHGKFKQLQLQGNSFFKNKHNPEYSTDPELSVKGILENINQQNEIRNRNIRYVFTSPLRRCLETVYELYKNFPIKKRPQIIVHPELREQICTYNDFPLYWKYALYINKYSYFDFSLMKPLLQNQIWFSENAQFSESQKILLELFNSEENILNNLTDSDRQEKGINGRLQDIVNQKYYIVHDIIKREFPYSIESSDALRERIELFLDYLRMFCQGLEMEKGKKVEDDQILIVTHYNILEKIYENEDKKMEQNTHFENSMIVRYNLNFD